MIFAALLGDAAFGDPARLPHPVRLFGAVIAAGERALWSGDSRRDAIRGALLAAAVIAFAAMLAVLLIGVAGTIARWLAATVAIALAWTTLAARGLDDAAGTIERALAANDIACARKAIPALVGRDPESLDPAGMIRATIESVAENAADGIIAPLFFLFIGGPAAAFAYKAINTLDSMIGYRDARYLYFGRAAARSDDAANFLPARLTALCLIAAAYLTGFRGAEAWRVCRADARRHQSPNAGYPESAMAGALGLRLGGDAIYNGEVERRATLGAAGREPAVADIAAARRLMRFAVALAFCVLTLGRLILTGGL
jgi:adenosylcobinamide-phosphate synthase